MLIPKQDKIALIANLLRIDNKQGLVVPFKFNKLQQHFHLNKSHRNIILKHRQGGCSGSVLADQFTDCIFIPHTQCAVVSHEGRATQRLLDRVQFFYDSMDEPRPQLGAESRSEKSFPELHSSIYIGTAGARAFGRGDTIKKALLSELAYYEDAERILSGVEDAVPMTGELTIECTPNGESGEGEVFYREWIKAREGKSPYKPFFFPWWWSEDYAIPRNPEDPTILDLLQPQDRGELSFTSEELELVTRYNLSEDQIRWRRYKIAEKGGLFWQEYPEDEVSCFLTVGDPVFDQYVLNTLAQSCTEGSKHPQGWTYWIPPQEKMRYFIGADSSAGAPGGSYSAAVVIDDLWRVCATFQARMEPHIFAGLLKQLGIWYNQANIAIERNFTGYAVLGHLGDYSNLYHQRDFLTGKVTSQLGWWTNTQTKEYMQTRLKEKLTALKIWDINLIRQLKGYRYIKYKPTAQTFNDLAVALMIAVAVRSLEGTARGYQGSYNTWNW